MEQYVVLLDKILTEGTQKHDRTKTGTLSIFGYRNEYYLQDGFPLLWLKKTNFKAILNEFLWMVVHGSTDVGWLNERGHTFWDAWKDDDGTIGKGYGWQFRRWGEDKETGRHGVDQVQSVINSLKTDPYSRRHTISLWNVSDLKEMSLPPCHGIVIQFNPIPLSDWEREELYQEKFAHFLSEELRTERVKILDKANIPKFKLDLQMYQRSVDVLIGLPFNIGFYSIFLQVMAQLTNMVPNKFSWVGGDCHVYQNHMEAAEEVLNRWYNKPKLPLPTLKINPFVVDINDFKYEDFSLEGYKYYEHIPIPVAV